MDCYIFWPVGQTLLKAQEGLWLNLHVEKLLLEEPSISRGTFQEVFQGDGWKCIEQTLPHPTLSATPPLALWLSPPRPPNWILNPKVVTSKDRAGWVWLQDSFVLFQAVLMIDHLHVWPDLRKGTTLHIFPILAFLNSHISTTNHEWFLVHYKY